MPSNGKRSLLKILWHIYCFRTAQEFQISLLTTFAHQAWFKGEISRLPSWYDVDKLGVCLHNFKQCLVYAFLVFLSLGVSCNTWLESFITFCRSKKKIKFVLLVFHRKYILISDCHELEIRYFIIGNQLPNILHIVSQKCHFSPPYFLLDFFYLIQSCWNK